MVSFLCTPAEKRKTQPSLLPLSRGYYDDEPAGAEEEVVEGEEGGPEDGIEVGRALVSRVPTDFGSMDTHRLSSTGGLTSH